MYLVLITLFLVNTSVLSIDFGAEKDGRNWQIINDGVMGGLSLGQAGLDENSLLFVGRLSFENNGGFASLRSNRMRLDLSEAEFVEIRYRLDGIKFSFMFEQFGRFWQPYYSYPLEKTDGEWVTKIIPVESLMETRMSEYTGTYYSKDSSRPFFRIGFISDEKKLDRFELEIDYISIF